MTRPWIGTLLLAALLGGSACEKQAGSPGGVETSCTDGVDNDRDGNTDCADSDCEGAAECVSGFIVTLYSEDLQNRGVDLLVVIDNSAGTGVEQEMLRNSIDAMLWELYQREGGLPDLHVGVVTTDLGAGGSSITYCEDADGDGGNLVTGACAEPTGAPYIVDAAPQGCVIERPPEGGCTSHDCTAAHCGHEPTTTLVEDGEGCPRCRNYSASHPADVFDCIGDVGEQGCGFEQPLESMFKALDSNPANTGFLRQDAHLAVVIMADEDDCSVADPYFFDMSSTGIDDPLGPISSFRCFEFGVTCDIDDRTHVGLRENCAPRDDPDALLHPISRYTQFLRALKWDEDLTVAVIAGPVNNDSVIVGQDDQGHPELEISCPDELGAGLATPGIRLKAFASALNAPEDMDWAFSPTCVPDGYMDELRVAGQRIVDALGDACAPFPPVGCTDVAVEFGYPGDGQTCNDVCRPSCAVSEIHRRGTPEETEEAVPPCLEVCASGPCPGNLDSATAYDSAHPQPLDSNLPVTACWQMTYDARCEESNGAKVVVSRREPLPPRSMTSVACNAVTQTEYHCNDGQDNDGDCLTDAEDPDCGS